MLKAGDPNPEILNEINRGSSIKVSRKHAFKPLETIKAVSEKPGTMVVLDGMGREYFRTEQGEAEFMVSGALGYHLIILQDKKGRLTDMASFRADCKTELEDSTGKYKNLLVQCMLSMTRDYYRPGNVKVMDERIYRGFVITSRDHAHGLKGMKYFYPFLKEWMDAFAESQREDGMVFDFFINRNQQMYHMEWRFPPEFYDVRENGKVIFARQPMMNDVEHMFIQGIYWTWKSTGDEDWMRGKLDNCLKAVEYATSSPYIWSEKFRLLKRTFTIDTWDFQSVYDSAFFDGDIFMAEPGISEYGVMFGDNTGMAISCYNLAEMLEIAGRKEDARKMEETADGLLDRLEKISWNGEYYTMFVPENPGFKRDFNVDPDEVVSLSNAYSLNRRISHDKAVAIIRTYQRLREQTRDFAQGEWYCAYPPFTRGFNIPPWHYVNGGVSPMVAGELAHGTFEHGYEQYGADIIERVIGLLEKHGMMPGVWLGRIPGWPEREFTPLDFMKKANAGLRDVKMDAVDWDRVLSGRQDFRRIPFEFVDPAMNKGRNLILLSREHAKSVRFELNRKAASIYFLHAMEGGQVAGSVSLRYTDGSEDNRYFYNNEQVEDTWNPSGEDESEMRGKLRRQVAFTRKNEKNVPVGMVVYGLDNPHPEKTLESLELKAAEDGARWVVAGLTLSDHEVFFMPEGLSKGIPRPWSVGAMVYALMEGLAGIYDQGANYSRVKVSPRWTSAGEKKVDIIARYEAGGGYVAYRYRHSEREICMLLTSSAGPKTVEILLPGGRDAQSVTVNGNTADHRIRTIEGSRYAVFELDSVQAADIALRLS